MTSTIETRLEQAQEIYSFVQSARNAASTATGQFGTNDVPARTVYADERAAWLTAHFGFVKATALTPQRNDENGNRVEQGRYDLLMPEDNDHVQKFLSAWDRENTKFVESIHNADGTMSQHLPIASVEQSWQQLHGRHYPPAPSYYVRHQAPGKQSVPTADAFPFHLAYAMTEWVGLPWKLEDNTLVRHLPKMPLRLPKSRTPSSVETEQRVRVACNAWAFMPPETLENHSPHPMLVYASLIGQQKELLAVKASIVDAKRGILSIPFVNDRGNYAYHEVRRRPGKGVFHHFVEYLPESDHYHMVMQSREELEPKVGMGFPHIVGADGAPDLERLFKQLDVALRLPVDPSWMEQIWAMATVADVATNRPALIVKLTSSGCTAFWVCADHDAAWSKIISVCAGGTSGVEMEVFGELHTVAQVEEIVSEADGDDDSDTPDED